MTMLVAGIDWSTKAIDVAIIPLDHDHGDADLPRVTLRRDALPHVDADQRPAHAAYITTILLRSVEGYDVRHVFVEEPWTRSFRAAGAMFPVYGAILAASWLPPDGRRRVSGLSATRWRQTLKLGRALDKQSYVQDALRREPELPRTISDHQAEAYLIALAGRHLLRSST